jgi:hypothetical protein
MCIKKADGILLYSGRVRQRVIKPDVIVPIVEGMGRAVENRPDKVEGIADPGALQLRVQIKELVVRHLVFLTVIPMCSF